MRIFVLLPRIPFPLHKGDKLRAYHQIKLLAQNNEVFLFALNDNKKDLEYKDELLKISPNLQIVNLSKIEIFFNLIFCFIFSNKPIQTAYFYNRKAKHLLKKKLKEFQPNVIYSQLLRTAEYIKDEKDYFRVLDFQDAFSMGMKRRAEKSRGLRKLLFLIEYKRLRKYENKLFSFINRFTIISNTDRLLINHSRNNEISIIENGVDFDFFHPIDSEKKYDLVFTGNMSYPPNIDSAEYLVNKIIKELIKKRPNIKLLIAGASPHPRVKALESKNVKISGWLNDIRDAYSSSKIFIAPMQIGTGLQNKLLEAMAMKIPCITSELANNALNAKESNEILVGSSVEEYIQHIELLLNDEDKAKLISENALKFVRDKYSWKNSVSKLENIFKDYAKA